VAARFGPGAARPVALHVLAKRYRCTLDPKYKAALSPASVRSQQAQGGLLDPPAIARFEASRDAPMPWPCGSGATGRRGDGAKDPDRQTDGIVAFLTVLQRFAVIGAIRPVDRRIINSAR
jgi:gamma-butyrobetaine dioxygenase